MTNRPLGSSVLRNVLSGWTVVAANILYALLITPIVVRSLGQENYGIWSFLNGLMGYSGLLYMGVGSALVKYISAYSAKGDEEALSRLVSVATTIFASIGTLVMLVCFVLAPMVDRMLASDLSSATIRDASITCGLLGVQLFLLFLTSSFSATLVGHDRFDLSNLGQIITILIRLALVSWVVSGPRPLFRLAVFVTATSAVELIVMRALAYSVDRRLRVRLVSPRRDELKILYGFGIPAFLINVAFRLISYTDTTVIGAVLGASSVALYAASLQLVEYSRYGIGAYASVMLPRVSRQHAIGDSEGLKDQYIWTLRITAAGGAFALANIVCLGPSFLALWLGPPFGAAAPWVVGWLAGATFLHTFSTISAIPFFQGIQMLGAPARVLILEAALNLGISILLARSYGIEGVAFATFLPACVTVLILPPLLWRAIGVPVLAVVKSAVLPAIVLALSIWLFHQGLQAYAALTSYASLAGHALASIPVAGAVALLVATRTERQQLLLHGRLAARKLLGANHSG